MSIIAEIRNLTKTYKLDSFKVLGLKNISMSLEHGEFSALVGPSGCGKSTLLNQLGCLDVADEGDVIIDGQHISKMTDDQLSDLRSSSIGFIFQSFNLIPVLEAIENVMYPLLLSHVKNPRKIAQETLELVELGQFSRRKPGQLSGGQRQRLAIARAIVCRPKLILADEPTANLDSKTSITIINLMKKLNKELNTTFLISSHH